MQDSEALAARLQHKASHNAVTQLQQQTPVLNIQQESSKQV